MKLLLLTVLMGALIGCALDSSDLPGGGESPADRIKNESRKQAERELSLLVGRFEGNFTFNKRGANGPDKISYPMELSLHVVQFQNGFDEKGSPVVVPRLIGKIDFLNDIVHSIEYVNFDGSYNSSSQELNLLYSGDDTTPLTSLRGKHFGSKIFLEYITPNGLVGVLDLKKVSNSVPSYTQDEIDNKKREDFANFYKRIEGDYFGYIKSAAGAEDICSVITIYTSYGENVELRALLKWKLDTFKGGLRVPLKVTYSPLTDQVTMNSISNNQNGGFSKQTGATGNNQVRTGAEVSAIGSFRNETLNLTNFEFRKGQKESFESIRYKNGKESIKNPESLCNSNE